MDQGKVASDPIVDVIKRFNQLHSAPEVVQSVLHLTKNDDFDMVELVDCISRDPALVAKLLRTVNSSRYGLWQPVINLQQGVAYLGQRTLRLIVMTFSILGIFTKGPAKRLFSRNLNVRCPVALSS